MNAPTQSMRDRCLQALAGMWSDRRLRRLGVSIGDVSSRVGGASYNRVGIALRGLVADGLLSQRQRGTQTGPALYVATPTGLALIDGLVGKARALAAAQSGPNAELRTRAWRALRAQHKASVASLLTLLVDAGAPALEVERVRRQVAAYLHALARAGVVQPLARGADGPRWLLLEDLGLLAPVPVPVGGPTALWDANAGRWLALAEQPVIARRRQLAQAHPAGATA